MNNLIFYFPPIMAKENPLACGGDEFRLTNIQK